MQRIFYEKVLGVSQGPGYTLQSFCSKTAKRISASIPHAYPTSSFIECYVYKNDLLLQAKVVKLYTAAPLWRSACKRRNVRGNLSKQLQNKVLKTRLRQAQADTIIIR